MTQLPLTPHRVIAGRIKELRKKRGWSAAHLAGEMTKAGVSWDRSVVANLELGRRASVSVEELFALAYVLSVAPMHLMVPPLDAYDETPYQVAPGAPPTTPALVRAWIRGQNPLGVDQRLYYSDVPDSEWVPAGGPETHTPFHSLVRRPTWKTGESVADFMRRARGDDDGR